MNRRSRIAWVVASFVLLGLSLIDPPFPREQLLQNGPTVVALLLLSVSAWRGRLSTPSLVCLLIFVWLHILGARYIYTFVPYDDWSRSACGTSVSELLGWERNHYDRLVHLCFGLLFVTPICEWAKRDGKMPAKWAVAFALFAVNTLSGLYEVFEWLLTVVMSPAHAEAYNGQQGDLWDAQKDIALAFAGSVIVALWMMMWKCRARSLRPD